MRPRRRTVLAPALALAALSVALFTGCSGGDPWAEPHPAPTPVGALGAGFLPSAPPSPEATINPVGGSWDQVRPSAGFRVVLITAGDDDPTRTLVSAVTQWADTSDVDMRTIPAEGDHISAIVQAVELKPDLVISAGNDLIDPLAAVTASHLDQQFLIVGAEIAEPTGNVTAVDWAGASFRGEGLGASSNYDPASFTAARSASAVRAGVASVLHGQTGIVLWLD